MRWFLSCWVVGCGWFSPPEVVDTGDSHDHSAHEHSTVWPEDTSVPEPGDWRWRCTEAWEAGSDLVGTWDAEVSTEGRLVALQDYNGCQAVFTHRLDGRTHAYLALLRANVVQDLGQRHGQPPQATEQLSETIDGVQGDADSTAVALAPGGMAGGLVTTATNLLPTPGNGEADALLFEVELGGRKVDMRSWNADPATPSTGDLGELAFSGDGEWVVVSNTAASLDPEVSAGQGYQLFARRTRQPTAPPRLLTIGADGDSRHPRLSEDGRFVVFESDSSELVAQDTNGARDIFVLDRDPDQNGVFEAGSRALSRVSVSAESAEANGPSRAARISEDGRFVVFESDADNLVPGDTNGLSDVFLRDRDADGDGIFDEAEDALLERISVDSNELGATGRSTHPDVSRDGRWVAFASESGSRALVNGAQGSHVFLRDRQRGVTALVTHDNAGGAALGDSYRPFLSRSGRTLVFETTSTTYDVEASPSDVHLGFAENPLWISAGR